jgi:hypothetical protein
MGTETTEKLAPLALKVVKTEGLEAVKPFCTLYTSVMLLSRSQIHSK